MKVYKGCIFTALEKMSILFFLNSGPSIVSFETYVLDFALSPYLYLYHGVHFDIVPIFVMIHCKSIDSSCSY